MKVTPKTFIVFGNFRGGTTMIAKCLKNMGVFMGHLMSSGTGEDEEFQTDDAREIIELIKKRNEAHYVWGWKFPNSIKYVDRFEEYLVNPHFICIFRDPYAIAMSEVNRTNQDFNLMFNRANQRNKKMIEFATSNNRKVLMLSYEHCITRREEFAKTLTKFVGEGTEEDVLSNINPLYGGGEYTYPS